MMKGFWFYLDIFNRSQLMLNPSRHHRTVKDNFPLPNIQDCLDSLAVSTFFSTLDMASGYYQIELEESDKKTAIVTRYGLFTLYIKNTFSGEVTGSCWLFSSHFSYAWNEMKNQLLTFPNTSITLQQLSTLQ